MILYDNPFSPFARKVRMVLDFKGLEYTSVDALSLKRLPELHRVSPRGEVPVLVDGDIIVAESADIASYLEDVKPNPALMPTDAALRAKARRWQLVADRTLDAVIHDVSLWNWPTHRRDDVPPPGLVEAGQRDLHCVLSQFEADLPPGKFLCGELSIADLALIPHVTSLPLVGGAVQSDQYPRVASWLARMRQLEIVQRDLTYIRAAASECFGDGRCHYEGHHVVWRGDRIEWLLARGFDDWWENERRLGRAVIPNACN